MSQESVMIQLRPCEHRYLKFVRMLAPNVWQWNCRDCGATVPSQAIDVADACELIAQIGLVGVTKHPACDEIRLKDGREITFWHGCDDYPAHWTIWPEANAAVINAARS